jgi:hypothetical protein
MARVMDQADNAAETIPQTVNGIDELHHVSGTVLIAARR